MVLKIEVSEEQWVAGGYISRTTMNYWLMNIIADKIDSFEDCDSTVVKLPANTTTAERYSIHKLTTQGFDSASDDDEYGNRIMKITLSKNYVKDLLKNYVFEPITLPPPPIKSERQILFDNVIQFVENNFQHEFQTFLNQI